jgi:hypothetical protein
MGFKFGIPGFRQFLVDTSEAKKAPLFCPLPEADPDEFFKTSAGQRFFC